MKLYQLSIGSNNKTKKLEIDKIEKTANKYFQGYSINKGLGYWNGQKEKTAFLSIATNKKKKVFNLTKELKKILKQQAVMVSEIGTAQIV